jgi:hypothetical protein
MKAPVKQGCFRGFLLIWAASCIAGILPPANALAEDAPAADTAAVEKGSDSRNWLPLGLQSFEPSAFGYQKNNDDVAFENIKISVKYPLFPRLITDLLGKNDRIYFAFTGAFDFYIGTRDSGPVVGKEYNPQLFWQHQLSCGSDSELFQSSRTYGGTLSNAGRPDFPCYFMVGYNHDSNGQIIDTPEQYAQTQRAQGTEAANDAISRGWDYIGFTAKFVPRSTDNYKISLYPQLKYFLSNGLLQGRAEELHYWETPSDGKPRKEVDGIGLLGKYQFHFRKCFDANDPCPIGDGKLAVRYGTGYQDPFKFSTVRIEAGIQVFQLPIVFWTQKGYMSDLSQYYRNVKEYGVEIEIGAF